MSTRGRLLRIELQWHKYTLLDIVTNRYVSTVTPICMRGLELGGFSNTFLRGIAMKMALSTMGLRCSLVAVLMAGSLLVAQEKKAEIKAPAAAKKSVNRLPNNYAKLGISEDQKKKILEIQAGYDPQIAALDAQLKALKDKEKSEVEAVLTPEQLKQLETIKAESKKKSDKGKGGEKTAAVAPAATEPAKKVEAEKKPVTEKKP